MKTTASGMNLLIKNANVIDANGKFQGDILIIDGIINQIGKNIYKNVKLEKTM